MTEYNPGKSRDPEVLLAYFKSLGLTDEEAAPLVANWSRTESQTLHEITSGILYEREARLNSSSAWAKDLKPKP